MAALGQIDQAVEDSLDMGKLVADDMELAEYIVAVGAFESLKLRLFMLIILPFDFFYLEEIGDSFVEFGVVAVAVLVVVVEQPSE